MLDWLKSILGDAYNDDIDKKVSVEIGKNFIARADFNAANEAKKQLEATINDRDLQLETLKASTGDVNSLKTEIATLQSTNAEQAKEHAAAIKQLKLDSAVETALIGAKAKNVKAVKALLDLNKAELSEDGTVKGLAEQLKTLTENADTGFLFDAGKKKSAPFKGLNPAEGGDKGGKSGELSKDMSYDELCAFLAENPNTDL